MSNTKDNILKLGEAFLKKKGVNAFSYRDISTALGVKNAAIHYHFDSKEALIISIIKENSDRFMSAISQMEGENVRVVDRLDGFFDIYRKSANEDQKMCLFGSLGSDYFTVSENIQRELQALSKLIVQWLTQLLEKGKNTGVLTFKSPAGTMALMICSCMAGALQLSRLSDKQDFYAIIAGIYKELGVKDIN